MHGADFILFNARIWTADSRLPYAEALAVEGDRLVLVGSSRQALQRYPAARRIDARHLTILPGFIDAHVHVLGLGQHRLQLDLSAAASPADAARLVAEYASEHPNEDWIIGGGWDHNRWDPAQYPGRSLLDDVVPDRPVWLRRVDLHVGWANSAALTAAGIDASTPDPEGGLIMRDARGELTGILVDQAMQHVERQRPTPNEAAKRTCIAEATRAFHEAGITAVHDAGTSADDIALYQKMIDEQALNLRLHVMTDGRNAAYEGLAAEGPVLQYGDRLNVQAVKFFMDGALGSRGAALLQEYADDPGNAGLLMYEPDEFEAIVLEVTQAGLQVCTHAIGDRAVRHVLDAYERAMTPEQRQQLRPRIEHAQVLHPDDVSRFAFLDVMASMQPVHAVQDRGWAGARLGEQRLGLAYAWAALHDAGAQLAFGSDAPVAPPDPLAGIAEALPTLGHAAALRACTIDAARAGFQDTLTGSITAGKMADLVVLAGDVLGADASEIASTRVVATFVGGRRVYGGW